MDFWRAEPTGRFYLYRALQDDLVEVPQSPKDGTTLDFTQATLHTAEAIAVTLIFARAMGFSSEETTLHFTFRWSGLEGRELSASESSEPSIPPGYICHQNTIRSVVAVPMETPTLALGQVVQDATAPLFAAFEGFEFPARK